MPDPLNRNTYVCALSRKGLAISEALAKNALPGFRLRLEHIGLNFPSW